MAFILIPAFLTTGTDPSHSFRMTINISLLITPYRFPPYETLSFNRHSERCQECFVRKQESGNMTWSEESITRMTSLTDSSGHLYPTPFKFMHVKRTHISASPFPLSAASYPPGPLPAKYFRRL